VDLLVNGVVVVFGVIWAFLSSTGEFVVLDVYPWSGWVGLAPPALFTAFLFCFLPKSRIYYLGKILPTIPIATVLPPYLNVNLDPSTKDKG
jgi:hypothetical protein